MLCPSAELDAEALEGSAASPASSRGRVTIYEDQASVVCLYKYWVYTHTDTHTYTNTNPQTKPDVWSAD